MFLLSYLFVAVVLSRVVVVVVVSVQEIDTVVILWSFDSPHTKD